MRFKETWSVELCIENYLEGIVHDFEAEVPPIQRKLVMGGLEQQRPHPG
jgi:hypothetical protein